MTRADDSISDNVQELDKRFGEQQVVKKITNKGVAADFVV